MKKLGIMLMVMGMFCLMTAWLSAHSYDSDDSDCPLRYVSYAVYPVAMAAEYLVLRPVHWLISRPHVNTLFGHEPHYDDVYFDWKPLPKDYEGMKPTLAEPEQKEEMEKQAKEEQVSETKVEQQQEEPAIASSESKTEKKETQETSGE